MPCSRSCWCCSNAFVPRAWPCRWARSSTPASALGHLDLLDRPLLRTALSSTLIKRHDDAAVFDELFDQCFAVSPSAVPTAGAVPPAGAVRTEDTAPAGLERLGSLVAALRAGDDDAVRALVNEAVERASGIGTVEGSERYFVYRVQRALDLAGLLAAAMRAERQEAPGASALDLRLARDDLALRIEELRRLIAAEVRRRRHLLAPATATPSLPPRIEEIEVGEATALDLAAVRAAVRPLARRLASRVAQRRRLRRHGRLDVRRTMRRSLGSGGVPLDPSFRHRKVSKPVVVVLCDLSGSVAEFAGFTLSLVHALHSELAGLRTFVFVDGVAEVTDVIGRAEEAIEPRHLLTRTGVVTGDGHSDYGRVFDRFWTVHAPTVLTPATTLIVAGDARTNHRPGGLASFRLMCERSRRTYWLNPERRAEWDETDSAIGDYAPWCTAVFEVRTLRQLADAVVEIV